MNPLYTAEVAVRGGRNGDVKSQDGYLNMQTSVPEKMGGDGSAGTNPEQLFAAAFGACFLSAMKAVADKMRVELTEPKLIVKVSINEEGEDGHFLSVALNIVEESVEEDLLAELVKKAHKLCPYSKATRGNIEVLLTANKIEVA